MESERINVSTLLALLEHHFYTLVGFSFAAFAMSVLPFGRCVARMEREMQRDGHPRPSGWDGAGLRIYWYASAIAFPLGWYNDENDPFINVPLVRQYAKKTDRFFAYAVEITGILFMVTCFMGPMIGAV